MMFFRRRAKTPDAAPGDMPFLFSKPVKYVSLRSGFDPVETIIGKHGYINLFEGRVVISCGNTVVFDMPANRLDIGELLSRDGATFTYEGENGGKNTVIAYYSYYRK